MKKTIILSVVILALLGGVVAGAFIPNLLRDNGETSGSVPSSSELPPTTDPTSPTTMPLAPTAPSSPTNPTDNTQHTHAYEALVVLPTCTERGCTIFGCVCGESYMDAYVDALNHDYQSNVIAPSCTEGGYTTHACSRCDDQYTDSEVGALGHSWSEWSTTLEPSIGTPGERARTCSACGDTETEPVAALPEPDHVHAYVALVVPATCSEGGYTQHTCSGCGDAYVDSDTAPLGHSYGSWAVSTPATCLVGGKEQRACTRCGNTESRSTEIVACAETVTYATITNSYLNVRSGPGAGYEHLGTLYAGDIVVLIAKTTLSDGVTWGQFSDGWICLDGYTSVHTETTFYTDNYTTTMHAATCTTDGYTLLQCPICGFSAKKNIVSALGHDIQSWKVTLAASCTATGQETGTCSRCGVSQTREVDAISGMYEEWYVTVLSSVVAVYPHNYDFSGTVVGTFYKGERLYVYDYSVGYVRISEGEPYINHSAWNGSSGPDAYGIPCDGWLLLDSSLSLEILRYPMGHIYGEWTATSETCTDATEVQTCIYCGKQNYRDVGDRHAYSVWYIVAPTTCTSAGEKYRYCLYCNETETIIEDAPGHTWTNWSVITQATNTSKGREKRSCSTCDIKEFRDIPVGGNEHAHAYEVIEVPISCTEGAYEISTCTICGHFTPKYIAGKLGHDWNDWVITRCTSVGGIGYKQRVCSRCGEIESLAIPPLNPDTGLPYESYIDPAVTFYVNSGYMEYWEAVYTYNTLIITDSRKWSNYIEVRVNEDDGLDVKYFKNDGTLVSLCIRQVSARDYKGQFGSAPVCNLEIDYYGNIEFSVDNGDYGGHCDTCGYPYWKFATNYSSEVGCIRSSIPCVCPVCDGNIVPGECHICEYKSYPDYAIEPIVTVLDSREVSATYSTEEWIAILPENTETRKKQRALAQPL